MQKLTKQEIKELGESCGVQHLEKKRNFLTTTREYIGQMWWDCRDLPSEIADPCLSCKYAGGRGVCDKKLKSEFAHCRGYKFGGGFYIAD
jgi:hypothetical protein